MVSGDGLGDMLVRVSEEKSKAPESGSITDHPGWFGAGYGGGIMAIHANWPAYPCAPGGGHGLFDLAQFPVGTRFEPIDDIDRCVLFAAYDYDPKKPGRPEKPWSKDAYQIAIWHEDLIALSKQGLIEGVTPISEREWRLRQRVEAGWQWGKKLLGQGKDGTISARDWPSLPELPNENDFWGETDPYNYPAFEHRGVDSPMTVTAAGWATVTEQLAASFEMPNALPAVRTNLDSGHYDTALREVGVEVEEALRAIIGSDDGYGQGLVDKFIKHLDDELFAYNTTLKIYRLRLRTYFKFTRNLYAHKKKPLERALALAQATHALQLLDDIKDAAADRQEE